GQARAGSWATTRSRTKRAARLCGGEFAAVGISLSTTTESEWRDRRSAFGVGTPATRGRGSEAIQAAAAARPTLGPQPGASRLLQPEIEQTAQRQAPIAESESGAVAGESNDE